MSKKKVFVSFAHEHGEALADSLKEIAEELSDVAPAQTALARRFRSIVEAYVDDKGDVDHKQVIRAFLISAKLYVDGLSDEDYDAVAAELPDEIAALRAACDPDDGLLNDS